jgi:3'-phosphoadenosine 5'-phosphosulfate sulfotransferase (PAPS reductase)/FAD synthetase
MRFCTSELKVSVICQALAKRFPGRAIVSAAGIRREESTERSKAPISKEEPNLARTRLATSGVTWNPLLDWTESDVRALCAAREFDLHEGYTKFGMSRISCAYCIMSNEADLAASASCPDNADVYREMVDLEITSTFAFQGSRWLGDVAPHLLTEEQRAGLARAKEIAALRLKIEDQIPDHLLYEKGWPRVMPTAAEAEQLCHARREIAELLKIEVSCTEAPELLARYADLMAQGAAKTAASAKKEARKVARKGAAS